MYEEVKEVGIQKDMNYHGTRVIDHVTAMIAYWDKNLLCRFANNATMDWLGIQRENLIGKVRINELFAKTYWEIEPYVNGALDGRQQRYERTVPTPNGGTRHALVNYYPDIVDGKVEGFYVHAIDITDLKKLEIELMRKNEIITEQNKRLLNFANIVSHNLRSYSSNLSTVLDFLVNAESEEEKEEMVNYLKNIAASFHATIDHLDEVVRVQNQEKIRQIFVNLREFVDKATNINRVQVQASKATVINRVPDDIQMLANPAYVESIILNFLTNAIKYKHPDRDPVIIFDACRKPETIEFTVRDNGVGINLAKHGKDIFGMYKTFHGNSDAHGIGLFIVKFQVESMGGQISVESEVGKGTTFKILFSTRTF